MKKVFYNIILTITLCINLCSCTFSMQKSNKLEDKLWMGITQSNMEIVKEAVSEGANVDKFDNKHYYEISPKGKIVRNPILVAIFRGEYEIAEYLIESGADVNANVDSEQRSMLQYCVEFSVDLSEKMVIAGADLNHVDANGDNVLDSAIQCATIKNDSQPFEMLIKYGVQPTNRNMESLLNSLCIDNFGIAHYILKHLEYIKINPTLKAAFLGDDEIVKNNFQTYDDLELLSQVVAAFCKEDTLRTIVENNDVEFLKLLKSSVLYNNQSVVTYLLYTNREKNFSDKELTYCAIKCNNVEMLKILLQNNVDFSMQDIVLGTTQYNCIDVLEYMLNNGLDVNFETGIGTPLVLAVSNNNLEMVKLLLGYGANINGTENNKPIIEACECGYVDIAEYLINLGANINAVSQTSKKGTQTTPLLSAVQFGHVDCVKLLLNHGADLHYTNEEGASIADVAIEIGAKEICNIIEQYSN